MKVKLSNQPIKVEIEQVFEWIKHSEKLEKYEHELLKEIPHLSLTYEEHLLHQEFHQKNCRQNYRITRSSLITSEN